MQRGLLRNTQWMAYATFQTAVLVAPPLKILGKLFRKKRTFTRQHPLSPRPCLLADWLWGGFGGGLVNFYLALQSHLG